VVGRLCVQVVSRDASADEELPHVVLVHAFLLDVELAQGVQRVVVVPRVGDVACSAGLAVDDGCHAGDRSAEAGDLVRGEDGLAATVDNVLNEQHPLARMELAPDRGSTGSLLPADDHERQTRGERDRGCQRDTPHLGAREAVDTWRHPLGQHLGEAAQDGGSRLEEVLVEVVVAVLTGRQDEVAPQVRRSDDVAADLPSLQGAALGVAGKGATGELPKIW